MAEEERRLLSHVDTEQYNNSNLKGAHQQQSSLVLDNSIEETKDILNFDKAFARAGGLGIFFH